MSGQKNREKRRLAIGNEDVLSASHYKLRDYLDTAVGRLVASLICMKPLIVWRSSFQFSGGLRRSRHYLLALLFAMPGLCAGQAAVEAPGGTMVFPRSGHSASLMKDGRVLVAGGGDTSGYTTVSEIYDPATNSWEATGNINQGRTFPEEVTLLDGRMLLIGGIIGGNVQSTVEIYDPTNGVWTYTGSMNDGRYGFDPVVLPDGRVLAAGGYGIGEGKAELYDPASGTWSLTGNLNYLRTDYHATLLQNGKVLIAGGAGLGYPLQAELYDPATGTFTTTGSLLFGRSNHIQVMLADGRVLVAGGMQGTHHGYKPTNDSEIYDPATGVWTKTGSMKIARYSFTGNLLRDGKVFAAGGFTASGIEDTATIEEYNPTAGRWVLSRSALASARAFHTTTTLLDSSLIVAGGIHFNAPVADAEFFFRPR